MCGYVLPPPNLTLIEKRFVENTGNGMLDGRENGWAIFTIVNDGRSQLENLNHGSNHRMDYDSLTED